VATLVLTSTMTLYGTSWTGTAPGAGNPTVSGTVASSTDFSDHIKQVNIDLSRVAVDFTNFGSGGFVENKPGLIDAAVSVDFFGDFAASSIDVTFGPLVTAGTLVFLDIKPTNAARSATNPSYVFGLYLAGYPVVTGGPGEAAMATVSFMSAGKYARLTA